MSAAVASQEHVTSLLATTVFHCPDHEEFGLSAKHAAKVADTLLSAGIFRDEATVKAEALREAASAAREEAANSRTPQGRYEAEGRADWLDDRATEIDPARLEGAHP